MECDGALLHEESYDVNGARHDTTQRDTLSMLPLSASTFLSRCSLWRLYSFCTSPSSPLFTEATGVSCRHTSTIGQQPSVINHRQQARYAHHTTVLLYLVPFFLFSATKKKMDHVAQCRHSKGVTPHTEITASTYGQPYRTVQARCASLQTRFFQCNNIPDVDKFCFWVG